MQKMKKCKKGFTLTELAIVIAVIAILIAVLVPTFVSLINKAKESSDSQLVKNMNTALSLDEAENGKPETASEAIQALYDNGFVVSNLTPTSDGYNLVYNLTANTIVLLDDENSVVYPESGIASNDEIWVIATLQSVVDSFDSQTTLSFYGYCITTNEQITLDGTVINFDSALVKDANVVVNAVSESGDKSVAAVTYSGTDSETEINAACDMNSLHLSGYVKTLTLTQGHVEVKADSVVKDVIYSVTSSENKFSVTGDGSAENTVIDTSAGISISSENYNTKEGTNIIYKTENIEGYGTESNPYIVNNSDTLKKILAGNYGNVTMEVKDGDSSSTVVAAKTDDGVTISGELSEDYYSAVADSVTLTGEYRVFVTSSGSSSVTLAYAVESAETRIGNVYYDEFVLIAVSSSVTSNSSGSFTTITIGSAVTETNITLLNDVTLSQYAISIESYANVSIDLNGYELAMVSSLGNRMSLLAGATLTIDDSSEEGTGIISSDRVATLTNQYLGGQIFNISKAEATLNINGGTIIQYDKSCVTVSITAENTTFNMTGGVLSCPNGYSSNSGIIYGTKNSTVINISGGTINSKLENGSYPDVLYGINVAGLLNISGGEIYAKQAIKTSNTTTITGGIITGTTYAIYSSGSTSSTTAINISDGTLSGGTYTVYCVSYTDIAVTGGTVATIYFCSNTCSAIVAKGTTVSTDESKYTLADPITSGNLTSYTVTVTSDKAYAYIVRDGEYLYYASLSAAVSGAKDGETIYMLKDSSNISTSKSLTIDMNGYSISSSGNAVTVSAGGNLTLINSSAEAESTIKTTSTSSTWSFYALKVYPGATLTLGANITATSAGYWTAFVGEDNSTEKYDTVATLNVYGKITNTNSNGVAVSGYGVDLVGGSLINIYDGAVIESAGLGIYHPQVGTLNIYGGTISGVTGIEMRSGTLNVEGGTISSTATEFSVNANGSGSTVSGAAIAISQHTTQMAITVTITGGTISGYYALYETDTVTTSTLSENVTITISGTATLNSTAADATNGYYSANGKVTDSRS